MSYQKTKPTLRSIAEHLDTSICTVSRVLNGKGPQHRIAEATQKRILDHVKKINYRPNVAAQSLRRNRMQEIGLILPDLSNSFFTNVAKYAANEARKRNYSVQIIETDDNTEREIEAISHMLHRHLEGLIIWPVGLESEHFSNLPDNVPPIVLVDRCFPELKFSQVTIDDAAAAEMATLHLLDFGHREIACFQGLERTATNRDRLKGYRRALESRGVTFNETLVIGDSFTQASGYSAIGQLLTSRPSATAILSLSNQNTIGTLRGLAERGMRVPEDFSLVSFDEIDGVEFFATPITVVSQPLTKIGIKATELLFQHIDGVVSTGETYQLLSASLIKRSSVKQCTHQ